MVGRMIGLHIGGTLKHAEETVMPVRISRSAYMQASLQGPIAARLAWGVSETNSPA